jgi:GGDEF domain-containing protein
MMPDDTFSMGKFSALIVGIETPVLVIQFEVKQPGGYQFVNAITEAQHFRWTMTSPQAKRVPPQPGRVLKLDFAKRNDLLIGRDEGFTFIRPTDIPLYHQSVGEPHARLTKITFLNGTVGYGVEAIKGTVYVGEQRLQPGESVEEFPSGTVIGVGKFKMKMNWTEQDGVHPTLEIVEAPAAEAIAIESGTTFAEGAGESSATEGVSDLASLDTLDALAATTPSAPSEAPSGVASLDDLLAAAPDSTAGTTTPATPAPTPAAPEESLSLDALLSAPTPEPVAQTTAPSPETPAAEEAAISLDDLFAEPTTTETPITTPQPTTPTPEPPAPEPEPDEEFLLEEAQEAEALEEEHAEFSLADLLSASEDEDTETFEAPAEEETFEEPAESGSLDALFTPPPPAAATDADRDAATGFLAPTRTERVLADEWESARTADIELSVVLIDFERILNRPSGEAVMAETASLVHEQFGDVAILGRLDNERLAVILPNVPEAEAYEVAETIQDVVRRVLASDDAEHSLRNRVPKGARGARSRHDDSRTSRRHARKRDIGTPDHRISSGVNHEG